MNFLQIQYLQVSSDVLHLSGKLESFSWKKNADNLLLLWGFWFSPCYTSGLLYITWTSWLGRSSKGSKYDIDTNSPSLVIENRTRVQRIHKYTIFGTIHFNPPCGTKQPINQFYLPLSLRVNKMSMGLIFLGWVRLGSPHYMKLVLERF